MTSETKTSVKLLKIKLNNLDPKKWREYKKTDCYYFFIVETPS